MLGRKIHSSSLLRAVAFGLVLGVGLLSSRLADAADPGPLAISSPAEAPFRAELSVHLQEQETPDQVAVSIGTEAEYHWLEIERPGWIEQVSVEVANESGEVRVRLATAEPPPVREFSILLVVSAPSGRSLRQYDVRLLDADLLPGGAGRPADEEQAAPSSSTRSEASKGATTSRTEPASERREAQPPARQLTISAADAKARIDEVTSRVQRLEEARLAEERARKEADARIRELQSRIDKLQKLLALQKPAAAAPSAPAAAEPAAQAAEEFGYAFWLGVGSAVLALLALLLAIIGMRRAGRLAAGGPARVEPAEEPKRSAPAAAAAETTEDGAPAESAVEPGWLEGAESEARQGGTLDEVTERSIAAADDLGPGMDPEAIEHARASMEAELARRGDEPAADGGEQPSAKPRRGRKSRSAEAEASDSAEASQAPAGDEPAPGADSQLNLARAYIEMGDLDGARTVLEEVARGDDAERAARARVLLEELEGKGG